MTLDNDNDPEPCDTPADVRQSVAPPQRPTVHQSVDAPLCDACQRRELYFLDPTCPGCSELVHSTKTTVPELFAVLRQWTPQTQQNIEVLVQEILSRDVHVDDRDSLTDMSLLHYAAKSGTTGVGDPVVACRVVQLLLGRGADVGLASRWTGMTALHYAAYFNVHIVIGVLLGATHCEDINRRCPEFDMGTALHIATHNLSLESVQCLLELGADHRAKDELGRIPIECIPSEENIQPQLRVNIKKIEKLLEDHYVSTPKISFEGGPMTGQGRVTLQSMGLHLGDKVVVGGVKRGRIRFCGPTEFAGGIWAGIELDLPEGKNEGTVSGVTYFECPAKHGIFAPIGRVTHYSLKSPVSVTSPTKKIHYGTTKVSHVAARIDTGLRSARLRAPLSRTLSVTSEAGDLPETGDRVIVAGQRKGVVKYVGQTEFASGLWYGVELDRPAGKNDGMVSDVRYFTCRSKHGVFAPPSRIQKIFGSSESLDSLNISLSANVKGLTRSDSRGSLTDSRSRTPVGRTKSSSSWKSNGSSGDLRLCEGMSVFCSNELGVVRYIGPTHFSDGTWLGVELRTSEGKNDGSVQGHRYFSCKPNHGLLVRPSKVTVRGINGAKLLGESFTADV